MNPEPLPAAPAARDWPGPRLFAAFLGGLIALCFWPVLLGGETFYFRDFGSFGYPLAHYHRECFWRGELPLWNPLSSCGLPFLAQWNTLTLYPLSLVYLLLPLPWSLNLFVLLHLFLAGLGMYLLAFDWTNHRRAAALAGTAFAFNGLLLSSLMWPNNMAAFGWMPWVVWLAGRAARDGGRWCYWAILVAATQMLAGAPEVILLTWLSLGGVELVELASAGISAWRESLRRLARLGLVVLAVAALAAVQLLPFLDLLRHSHRTSDFQTAAWAMPPTGWANLLLPLFQCHPTAHGVFYQPNQYWTASYYVGAVVLGLALLAFRGRANARVVALGILMLLGLLMALGAWGKVYVWATTLFAPLNMLRFPVKFVVLPVFALPLLAGLGWARLDLENSEPRRRFSRIAPWLALPVALLIGLAAWSILRNEYPETRMTVIRDAALHLLLAGLMIAGLLYGLRHPNGSRPARISFCALAVLLALDLLSQAHRLNPTVSAERLAPRLLTETELAPFPVPGGGRVLLTRETHDLLNNTMMPDKALDVLGRRSGLIGNYNLLDGIANAAGFFSLYLPAQNEVWERLFFSPTNAFAAPLADFLGITFVPDPIKTLSWQFRPSALPLITAGQQPVFLAPSNHLEKLIAPSFDPRRVVYLPDNPRPLVSAIAQTNALIGSYSFSARRIEFGVTAAQPAMVVIAQAAYHPWHAYVDNEPAPLWTANHAFQALQVPAGRHAVRLVYEDRAFRLGTSISLAALLCLVAVLLIRGRRPAT